MSAVAAIWLDTTSMSQADRDKWDKRYREGSYGTRTYPTELLTEWLPRLPKGRALDVACGTGRNALYLAAAGYTVDGIDISSIALQRLKETACTRNLTVKCIEIDLDSEPLPYQCYDLIVLVRYRSTSLISRLLPLLNEGGYFFGFLPDSSHIWCVPSRPAAHCGRGSASHLPAAHQDEGAGAAARECWELRARRR